MAAIKNKNKVVLSTTAPKIQNQVRSVTAKVTEEAGNMVQQISDIAASLISTTLGINGGYLRIVDSDNDGMIDRIFIANNTTPSLATKVIRIDRSGIARSTNGYNGPFYYGINWQDSEWYMDAQRMEIHCNGVTYVPRTITYKDGNGNDQTLSVLAEEEITPDLDEPLLEE